MTTPERMTTDEALEELLARVSTLEQVVRQRDNIIASAVAKLLVEEEIIEELIRRTTAAVEAEWTGKFLPEIRAMLIARLENLEQQLPDDGRL